jgi:hypothetical protein
LLYGKVVGRRVYNEDGRLEYEVPLKDGKTHGIVYAFHGECVRSREPFRGGLAHGTAKQWAEDGQLIGAYTMKNGTGLDLWRCKTKWGTGRVYLVEARYIKSGMWHGFEWWLDESQKRVDAERHFWEDYLHGIERVWNSKHRLKRGFPRYWIHGNRVTKRQYLRACLKDFTLPPFREKDNRPQREFPEEVRIHCISLLSGYKSNRFNWMLLPPKSLSESDV